jgi:hypothetical protein
MQMQMMPVFVRSESARAANSVRSLSPPCGEREASAEGASRVRGSLAPRNFPSPAGLTTQVGFTRLAHLKRPNSGVPDFGWSILFVRTFFRTGWIAGSGPAMTTAIAARVCAKAQTNML